MKYIGIIATGFIFALAIWFGLQYAYQSSQPADINLAITAWPTGQLIYAANQLGYFDNAGVKVKIVDHRDKYSEAVNQVNRGEVDGGVFVLSEPLLLTLTGKPMEVVMGLDYSDGADGLVVSQEIKTISDLKDKTVAYQPGSFGDLLLQQALLETGIEPNDISTKSLSPAEASRAFLLGEVDAAVTVEPFLSQALVRNGSRTIFSSSESPGLLPDVIAFNKQFSREHPVQISQFVQAWLKFKHDIEIDDNIRNQAYSIVAIRLGETLDSVQGEFAGIHVLQVSEAESAFLKEDSPASLYRSGQIFLDFFSNRMGLDVSPIKLDEILNSRYVENN
jgi:NitT/TauT family transport system substrate-binding protein